MRTTYGSPLFADHIPTHDSLLVERLRQAGAVIIGKTNTPEFGAGSQTFNAVFGATRNPHDLTKTPGGSSGGAAAAVASGMLPFADGSDLGASVRNPAAFCGLMGLRPTPGRIPDHGPGDPWNPLPVLGAIARNAPDVALLFHALAGPDPRDPLSIQEPWPLPPTLDDFDPSTACGSPGAGISAACPWSPRSRPCSRRRAPSWRRSAAPSRTPSPTSAARTSASRCCAARTSPPPSRSIVDDLKPTLRANVRFGQHAGSDPDRARPSRCAASCSRACASSSPATTSSPAPTTQVAPFSVDTEYPTEIAGTPMGSYLEWFRSCSRITVTAHPALSVPAGLTPDGLPIGLQLVGRHRGELDLLRLARALRS